MPGPPFDPSCYVEPGDIRVEESEVLPFDGCMVADDDSPFRITINARLPWKRKRFTLAHEIAHTFFYRHLLNANSVQPFDKTEEWLCNLAAAEMLMPAHDFKRDINELVSEAGHLLPTHVLFLSHRYATSMTSVMARISQIQGGVWIALWKRKDTAVDAVHLTPGWLETLTLCQTGNTSVEQAWQTPGQVISKRDAFILPKHIRRLTRQVRSLGLNQRLVLSVIDAPRGLVAPPAAADLY